MDSFDTASQPPLHGSKLFLSGRPLHGSDVKNAESLRGEFLAGAKALGFEPTPQQWEIANVLNSQDDDGRALYETVAVCVPRRAGKTTVILALAIGRCLLRPGHLVLFTAQSGTKASARYLQMARELERVEPDADVRGFRILRGAGHQVIYFVNGSVFQVLPPKPDAFRGDSADLLILDEAQEHDADESQELMGAILPTMDTRPGAQIVVAGTAGERRSGMFWEALQDGRTGKEGAGIVEFAAPDGTTEEEAADEELWQRAHPGIGTLTDLKTIRTRHAKLPTPQFLREYLGVWPEDFNTSAIEPGLWNDARAAYIEKPDSFALAFDVAPDQSTAAIAAAWRVDGVAFLEIVDHRQGVDWLGPRLIELAKRYRVLIGHDTIGAALVESEWLQRQKPRPRMKPCTMRDVTTGCNVFMKELVGHRLRHFGQPSLDDAAAKASKRPLTENSWAWGRKASGGDITPLVAATLALRTFDSLKEPSRMAIVSSRAS